MKKIRKIYDYKSNNKEELLQEVKENRKQFAKVGKYQMVTLTHENWFRITSNGRSFLPDVFAGYFCNDYELYVCEDKYYIYSDGYYKLISKNSLLSLIESEFRKFDYQDFKSNWTNECISRVESRRYISFEDFENKFNCCKDVINVKNGILKFNFDTGDYKFIPHGKNNLCTIQLNVKYDKASNKLDNWNNFLKTSLNTEKERMFLQEFMGYCFINHLSNTGQNIYCFHGEGGNGKGTVKRLLNSILGNGNVCDSKARLLTDSEKQNQFFGFEFKDKLLLSATETNYNFKDLSLLKMLSGGDRQSTEIKGLSQKLDYDFKGKILLSTNNKIKIYDTSKGTKRRLKFIVMDNDIKKVISDLDDRLRSEKESIFIWCLEGLKRLIKNDFIHTLPESHFDIFNHYMEHSNNYLKFIRNHIKIGGSIIKTDIFKLFNEQYGNIYKDKDDLYSNFEKELKNENIKIELRKIRNKSLFDLNEKHTINYIGISYIEHKENELNDCEIVKTLSDDVKNSMIDKINGILDIPQLEIHKNVFTETFKKYDMTDIEEIINKKINQIKANRGEDLQNIVKKNEQIDVNKVSEAIKKAQNKSLNDSSESINSKDKPVSIDQIRKIFSSDYSSNDIKRSTIKFVDIKEVNLNMGVSISQAQKLYKCGDVLINPDFKEKENKSINESYYKSLNLKDGMLLNDVIGVLENEKKL